MTTFIRIEEPPAPTPLRQSFALWELGFRPFYLLASAFSAISIGLWAMQFAGWLGRPYLEGPIWHAHEMLFGFTLAVVVGFLFTAGRNWANRATPTGWLLAALALLWVAGRVLVLTPWGWAAAIVNAAFPAAAAIALAIPFVAAGVRRNYFFVALLLLMSCASLAIHLQHLGVIALPARLGIQIGLDAVLFIVAVMAGRVIPMFTNNGVPQAGATRVAWLEKVTLGLTLVLLASDLIALQGATFAVLATACAAAHAARWAFWRPWKTLRTPIVWVLHLAYLWIPVHLALRALASAGLVTPSVAVHALTVGAIGGLIIGMMTRTAKGHTARPLRAYRWDIAAYTLVSLAALLRVVLPLVVPELMIASIIASAALWSAAFGLYAICYWPVLTRPRLDGKPG
ncbi:MAG: NnrS family protein [Pseudomonadota bacterium]